MACSCVDCYASCPFIQLDIDSDSTFTIYEANGYSVMVAIIVVTAMTVSVFTTVLVKMYYRKNIGKISCQFYKFDLISDNEIIT